MAGSRDKLPTSTPSGGVEDFLTKVAATPRPTQSGTRGRLIFAMDATASRQPSWDRACRYQSELFHAAEELGGLDVQLVFYRGFMECRASPWTSDAATLNRKMTNVTCLGGMTQIGRVLSHALRENEQQQVQGLVFVGDCVEEHVDELCAKAGQLGVRGVPIFIFHEGNEPLAENAFRQIARLSKGVYCRLDAASGEQLRQLLAAIAVFAAGGRPALEAHGKNNAEARRIAEQLRLTHSPPDKS